MQVRVCIGWSLQVHWQLSSHSELLCFKALRGAQRHSYVVCN